MSDLDTAIEHHQRGELGRAEAIYKSILQRNPANVDAMHLLGVVFHQRGRNAEALPLVLRSVAIRPMEANYHGNLGEVYRAMGRYDKAVESYRAALRFNPDHADANNNLGVALMERGDIDAAIEHYQAAAKAAPRSWRIANNLGNALRLKGRKREALEWFRKAVEVDPSADQPRCNLGQALLESGDVPGALEQCQKAVEINPRLPEAYNNLGNVHRELDEPQKARECYQKALEFNKSLAVTYSNIAMTFSDTGKYREAIGWHEQSLLIDPTDPRTHCNLASVHEEFEHYEEAKARYELVIQMKPDYAPAYTGLAGVLQDMGHLEQAIEKVREAIRIDAESPRPHGQLGHLLEQLGKLGEAEESFRAALALDPKQVFGAAQLATLLRDKLPEEDFKRIEDLLGQEWRSVGQKAKLHFAMSQALDGRKEYAKAADHAVIANKLRKDDWASVGKRYDPAAHEAHVDRTIRAFTPDFFGKMRGTGSDTRRPVFIVGMPRSGTTLLEQVLAAHSKVYGAGELRLAGKSFEKLGKLLGEKEFSERCIDKVTGEHIQQLAREHLKGLDELNATRPRIVDKMPDNYQHLGLLSVMFPNAAFIHARRDLRDTAVSCWVTHFRSIRWACDQDFIAHRFEQYVRLMDHWRKVLPVKLLEVDYEDSVTDLEGVARRMVERCGLEWEPGCLEFHKLDRPVRTASLSQVRKPIYTTSKERWKRYESSLGGLFERLQAIPRSG